ncbi:MAG TPA: hypothetical protein VLS87_07300, partial [Woeseiaceae bacterium]|nr:hypothetical protein [Woeseiaceae bacterium]
TDSAFNTGDTSMTPATAPRKVPMILPQYNPAPAGAAERANQHRSACGAACLRPSLATPGSNGDHPRSDPIEHAYD